MKHHEYWTIPETHLPYRVLAQSQGDLVAGQGVGFWGQDPSELQALYASLPSVPLHRAEPLGLHLANRAKV